MKVVARGCCSGQKGEVSQNKEPPIVRLPEEDRKTQTMPCFYGFPPPHASPLWTHLHMRGANHPADKARIKAAPFSLGHQRCWGKHGSKVRQNIWKSQSHLSISVSRSLLDRRTPFHNKTLGFRSSSLQELRLIYVTA